ncbi:MAG TPA: 6-phosphogluconolactonase [Candidatus Baltobacteraceae bacterium]|nr:6-phosphogluconolactonase [Candidatus Baltobacteraceae bacterium]
MIERNRGELQVLPTPPALAGALADTFVDDANEAIRERGAFFVALAGGTTPKNAYELLAQQPRRSRIDWNHVFVYFGDERCVPPESPESNYKMASDAFLSDVGLAADHVHRMHGEDDPQKAAREYAELLIQTMGDLPRFDLILLGMGADGHTASLFPGTDPFTDDDRLVRAPYVDKLSTSRITFTPRVINSGRHVVIATEGLPKAPALYAVREGPYEPLVHPIQVVAPANGKLTWLVDRAAAAELPEE